MKLAHELGKHVPVDNGMGYWQSVKIAVSEDNGVSLLAVER